MNSRNLYCQGSLILPGMDFGFTWPVGLTGEEAVGKLGVRWGRHEGGYEAACGGLTEQVKI